ncbi:NAD(P)/FAD-dependent oxidoreductase [Acuticoccus mangrovi]|uniref:FAD-binding oxidoreductase n=1 Tax=Acuticoccus mangrovi TaxID=2796142 RepID=A0A934ID41_9HYPH|nr:FAD-dependent oxidoreductase [Acuticoccus mangrovi]MBJ3774319.1 FAD-binding oxidoreductase [Acuticoccus mangrovi]
MRVVICGGGIIGAATAYYLAARGIGATIVERTALAAAASGKSGGFLARDWCEGTPVAPLARRSFDLHAELANALGGGRWGYRALDTYAGADPGGAAAGEPQLAWIAPQVRLEGRIGTPATTRQVHPRRLTEALAEAACARGTRIVTATVAGIATQDGAVRGVDLADGQRLPADKVVVAMGPWSILLAGSLPLPAVYGIKGHSLVFDTGDQVPPEALFLEAREAGGGVETPEIFPRPDGTTYICALSSDAPLPVDPAAVDGDEGAFDRLHAICCQLSPVLARAKVLARQACHRPVAVDGLPLIGPVPGVEGAYLATAHSVWGILNGPATGEAMAALLVDEAPAVNLAAFDPGRLRPLDLSEITTR